jgi:hypothetical protein
MLGLKVVVCCTSDILLLLQDVLHGHQPRLRAGAGLQPCGCHSLGASACPHGDSFGSFFVFLFACVEGAAPEEAGTGGSRGISCGSGSSTTDCGLASCSSNIRGGSALSLTSWSAFIWVTPLSGSRDCSICMGCCLSGESSAEGFDAQRASACDASTFILSCRTMSCCCSAIEGGSKRVWRSHCIHDAATVRKVPE